MRRYIKLGDSDNVAVALEDISKGEILKLSEGELILLNDIPRGHKFSLRDVKMGEKIIKYDSTIGEATQDIRAGEWVHTHNVKTLLKPEWEPKWQEKKLREIKIDLPQKSFWGFKRKDGKVGIRNEIWIIPTVGCINGVLKDFACSIKKPEWIDDIKVLSHPYGCSQLGGDLEMTKNILLGLAKNPNAGGVIIVGLGCENLQLAYLRDELKNHPNVAFLMLQAVNDESEALSKALFEVAERARTERVQCPIGSLTIGVKCGGSDSLSGITANPLVGKVSDYITYYGGTVLMSEIPEIFGAEEDIISRIEDKETFDKFVEVITWFRNYYTRYNQPVSENPSPGNIKGGITTLEEKSLGAVKKSGSNKVTDVLRYGERAKRSGVNIVFGPGNDLVSTTALAGSGATMILFTTGRGTPFEAVVPTIKISTNSELYKRKTSWIDYNAGEIAEGKSVEEALKELLELIINVASGKKTKGEERGIQEIAIFKDGVIL
ncbi:MAG: altronate dehydratase family protein [Synergistetes bacterium]|nr:altronate dehydratase family protein [Synergistota bacterium]MDW8192852.1 altronate dehydratase family protein [Synergistota bacterium]